MISLDAALDGLTSRPAKERDRRDVRRWVLQQLFEGTGHPPALRDPATIYVTTYYVGKTRPIFRLVVQYLFWKTERTTLDLNGLGVIRDRTVDFSRDENEKNKLVWQIIEYGEDCLDEDQRNKLSMELAARLDVSYDGLVRNRSLSLMTSDEILETAHSGVGVQLHTHRHRFPVEECGVQREIEDNRAFLEAVLGVPADHFCYPSGLWSKAQWRWLTAAKIRSAVTCDPGLNDSTTPRLGLRRFLDADNLSQIEFEAESTGSARSSDDCSKEPGPSAVRRSSRTGIERTHQMAFRFMAMCGVAGILGPEPSVDWVRRMVDAQAPPRTRRCRDRDVVHEVPRSRIVPGAFAAGDPRPQPGRAPANARSRT